MHWLDCVTQKKTTRQPSPVSYPLEDFIVARYTHRKVEEEEDAVENHFNDVGGVGEFLHLLDVRWLDRADRFVGLSRNIENKTFP